MLSSANVKIVNMSNFDLGVFGSDDDIDDRGGDLREYVKGQSNTNKIGPGYVPDLQRSEVPVASSTAPSTVQPDQSRNVLAGSRGSGQNTSGKYA